MELYSRGGRMAFSARDGFLADTIHLEVGAGRVVPWPGGDALLQYAALHCGATVGQWVSD
jgi:hypothetical protein